MHKNSQTGHPPVARPHPAPKNTTTTTRDASQPLPLTVANPSRNWRSCQRHTAEATTSGRPISTASFSRLDAKSISRRKSLFLLGPLMAMIWPPRLFLEQVEGKTEKRSRKRLYFVYLKFNLDYLCRKFNLLVQVTGASRNYFRKDRRQKIELKIKYNNF